MERKAILGRAIALAVLAAVLVPENAGAYLLPAEAIFQTMARRRADIGFSSIVAEGSFQRGGGAASAVWEALLPARGHRVERKSGGGTEVIYTSGTKRWSFKLGERPGPAAKIRPEPLTTLVGSVEKEGGVSRGMGLLRAYGIDDSVVTLGRLEKRVAYVIGAYAWEPNKPQLWVDKELYLPVRLIDVDKASGSVTDTRYLGFGSAVTGEWFPARIEVWKDGALVETTTYSSARLNEEVSEDLFKTPS